MWNLLKRLIHFGLSLYLFYWFVVITITLSLPDGALVLKGVIAAYIQHLN